LQAPACCCSYLRCGCCSCRWPSLDFHGSQALRPRAFIFLLFSVGAQEGFNGQIWTHVREELVWKKLTFLPC
jgi:hypothetical protein